MRVIWTPEAQAHLDGIYQYVKRDAPFYAQGVRRQAYAPLRAAH